MVHFGQPRLRAARKGELQVSDLHGFPIAAWQALLDLIETLNVNHATGGTRRPNDSGGQAVENGSDVENNFHHCKQRIVKELRNGVEVWIVKVHPIDARGGQQETALDDNDARKVFNFHYNGGTVTGIAPSLEG